MTLTRGHSCVLCQQRKVRCDQQKPCTNCVRAQAECKVVPPKPAKKRRRKKKMQRRELLERIQKYEALLIEHGVQLESVVNSGDEQASSDTEPEAADCKDSEREATRQCVCQTRNKGNDILINSVLNDTAGFPFMVGRAQSTLTHLHPGGVQIVQLWQVYINNVNPLVKITHVPTLQTEIVSASADIAHASSPLEALMFCIYHIAVKSLGDEEVMAILGEAKGPLVDRLNETCQHALSNAGLMRSSNLMVLQAFLIYLLGVGREVDSRTLSCWMGIAVRMATHLRLHRDGYRLGLSPFETEQRRRLWWQLVALDERVAEITGSTVTILSSTGTDCQLPSNVNDADLHPDAKEPPVSKTGATEMLFYLVRTEAIMAASFSRTKIEPPTIQYVGLHHSSPELGRVGASPCRSPPFQGFSMFKRHMEATYIMNCEEQIPFHRLTSMMARVALCKLQLIDMLRGGNTFSSVKATDRAALFLCATEMLEYDTLIRSDKYLAGFHWCTALLVPIEGYMILVKGLQHAELNHSGDRAWRAICDNYQHRRFIRHIQNPLHAAFRDAVLAAWTCRGELIASRGEPPETPPHLVQVLQQHLSSNAVTPTQRPMSGLNGSDQYFDFLSDDELSLLPLDNTGHICADEWLGFSL